MNSENKSGGAVDSKFWGFDEYWQGVDKKPNAGEVGVLEMSMSISREAAARGSSWISDTEGLVNMPTLNGSIENCFKGLLVLSFAIKFVGM